MVFAGGTIDSWAQSQTLVNKNFRFLKYLKKLEMLGEKIGLNLFPKKTGQGYRLR